ncbi:MAG: type II secretion system protein [Victivallaceae bacterium]|nr:type II secretion system protein [Victivallaceae bacterium]NLK84083.1 type II secretion system protein [Lentisphaerota bacterium]MDD3116919.1 type II secretion system protein [Victivallaceae bacterium]MDD3703640.1 type II secretion system protein [Victivallaceae bacterium]MDD4317065.1 type II secretion system protein [Victivallaceae bacterium]
MTKSNQKFTLIEVIVSLAILGLSLVALLTLANSSQQRLFKARELWQNIHMLTQAAEYYLLLPSEEPEPITREFFDYPDFAVNVRYEDAEDISDDFTGIVGQPPLRCCIIELVRNSDRQPVETIKVDRIIYDNTTE